MNTSVRRPRRFVRFVAIGLAALLCTIGDATRHSARGQITAESVVVAIPSDDEFYVCRDRVSKSEVAAEVSRRLKQLPVGERIAYIKAASHVRYGTVVAVIDAIRATGNDRIGLVTDRAEDGRTAAEPETGPPSSSHPPAAERSSTSTGERPDAVVVIVRGRAESFVVEVDGTATAHHAMEDAIHERLSDRHVTSVVILAGSALPYSDIIEVLDAAKSAGAETIGFEIDYLQSKQPK